MKTKEQLKEEAWEEYVKVRDKAWEEYVKVRDKAWEEYVKVKKPAWKEYVKVEKPAWKEYEKVMKKAWKEYLKKIKEIEKKDDYSPQEPLNHSHREKDKGSIISKKVVASRNGNENIPDEDTSNSKDEMSETMQEREEVLNTKWKDEGEGFFSMVTQNNKMFMGFPLCYIALPKGHQDIGKDYNSKEFYDLDVNGGLTFGRGNVFGWDYGHAYNDFNTDKHIKNALKFFKKRCPKCEEKKEDE